MTSSSSSSNGFIQMGELADTATFSTTCGNGDSEVFAEYTVDGTNYSCLYTDAIHQFGNGGLFAVAYASGHWETFWNSNKVGTAPNLGFSGGISSAAAEVITQNGGAPNNYAMTWGPAGQVAWQAKTTGPYFTIDYSEGVNDFGNNWHLEGTPSPFTISWVG
jgi:hypothetical protein